MTTSSLNVELITIGHELLDGRRLDTNSVWIGQFLTTLGLRIRFRQTVSDEKNDIADAFRLAVKRSDLIISTGGLGPTQDDITFESVAMALDVPLESMLPKGATPILNSVGTAPGCFIQMKKKMIFCFPGVPPEMESMMKTFFADTVRKQLSYSPGFQKTYSMSGISEALIEERIQAMGLDRNEGADIHVAYTASAWKVDVTFSLTRHDGQRDGIFLDIDQKITSTFAPYLIGWGGKKIEDYIVEEFQKNKWKLAIAESMTGGLITSTIVNVPGCSEILRQGLVTYSYESKAALLNVQPKTLETHGAVSMECVIEMARGARKNAGVDFAVTTTGIAGPGGATEKKPVGLTYIAWVGPNLEMKYVKSTDFLKIVGPKTQNAIMNRGTEIEEHIFHDEDGFVKVQGFIFSGNRERNRMLATYRALIGLYSFINCYHPKE